MLMQKSPKLLILRNEMSRLIAILALQCKIQPPLFWIAERHY